MIVYNVSKMYVNTPIYLLAVQRIQNMLVFVVHFNINNYNIHLLFFLFLFDNQKYRITN